MADEWKTFSMLKILLATCETALDTLRAAGNPVDRELVADLERMTERTRGELAPLAERFAKPS
jgi:hypothetical protein